MENDGFEGEDDDGDLLAADGAADEARASAELGDGDFGGQEWFVCEVCGEATSWADMPEPTDTEQATGWIGCPRCGAVNLGADA